MHGKQTRRDFLSGSACTLLGGWAALNLPTALYAKSVAATKSRLALTTGNSRPQNVFKALKMIEDQVKKGLLNKKRIILKPNIVSPGKQLAATHVDCLEAVIEFLKPLTKKEIIIAESSAGAPTEEGFSNYGYYKLADKYKVKLFDLDDLPTEIRHVTDEHFYPQPVRFAKLLLDPENYVISAAVPKTHDRSVVTLSLKNIVVGAAIKDKGFRWGKKDGKKNDKPIIHGGNMPYNEGINFNLFMMSKILKPDLALIDGFQGMEGRGPVGGDPVDHKIALAGTDWLAADCTAATLMGFDVKKIGYLTFAAREGLGQADPNKIEVLGEKIADHIKHYRPHDKIENQYKWMKRGKA
ncbi:MAG: DUF362 domain-containing protein [Planctomycetota bacterium]|jgi:uncharacterized protein (DUF362 family)